MRSHISSVLTDITVYANGTATSTLCPRLSSEEWGKRCTQADENKEERNQPAIWTFDHG